MFLPFVRCVGIKKNPHLNGHSEPSKHVHLIDCQKSTSGVNAFNQSVADTNLVRNLFSRSRIRKNAEQTLAPATYFHFHSYRGTHSARPRVATVRVSSAVASYCRGTCHTPIAGVNGTRNNNLNPKSWEEYGKERLFFVPSAAQYQIELVIVMSF